MENILFLAKARRQNQTIRVVPHSENPNCLVYIETRKGRISGSGGSTNKRAVIVRVAAFLQNNKILFKTPFRIEIDKIGVVEELNQIDPEKPFPIDRIKFPKIP